MGWHLTQLTPEAAEKHDRFVHKAEDPAIILGWKPYTYRATKDAVSQWACHDSADDWEIERRLRVNHLTIDKWTEWRDGIRTTTLSPKS